MSKKTIEEKFDEFEASEDKKPRDENLFGNYNNYTRDVYFAKAGFKAGYELTQKELEEQIKEAREVIRTLLRYSYITEFPNDDYDEEELAEIEDDFKSARTYLEKWK